MPDSKNHIRRSWRKACNALLFIIFILVAFVSRSQSVVTNVTSTVTANGTYGIGAHIFIQVTFNEVVTVTDKPSLLLDLGINDRYIYYTGGSGTNTLTFSQASSSTLITTLFNIANGDFSSDLTYASTTALSGTIQNATLVQANLTLPTIGAAGSLSANKAIVIDETQASVTSSVSSTTADGTWFQGQAIAITVDFDEPVIVTGTPRIQLETGTTDQFATYASGSGNTTGTLTFNYTIAAGDVSADLDYISTAALALNGATIKDQSGNNATLTLAAPGAAGSLGANKNIVISGIAPTTPTTQATAITFTSFATNSLSFNWTSGNGQRRIILAKAGSAVSSPAVNGTSYTASTTFSSGTQIGSGNYVIYDGTGSSSSVTGLATNTIYYFKVFEYNGSTTLINYNTNDATGNPANHTTLATEPTTQGSISSTSVTDASATLNFGAGNGTSRIIMGYDDTDCCPTVKVPVDGTSYTGNPLFGSGDITGTYTNSGVLIPTYVLFSGSGTTSLPISNLRPSSSYKFYNYEYNGAGGSENYRSNGNSTTFNTSNPTNPKFLSGDDVPTTVSSTATNASVFSYSYYPSGAAPAINSITIKQGSLNQVSDWTEIISTARLRPTRNGSGGGTGCSGGVIGVVNATTIVFTSTGCSGIFDPSTNDSGTFYELEITFKAALLGTNPLTIDGKKLGFAIDNSSFVLSSGSMDGSNVEVSSTVTVRVTASKLQFIQQPPAATWTNIAMTPAVTVEATDANGNRDLDFVSAGGLTSTGTLSAAQSATFSTGVGTYSNIIHSATGTGLTLTTTNTSGLTNAASTAFLIAQPLQLSPDVMTLYPRSSNSEKIVMTLTKATTLTSGALVTGFTTSSGTIASAVYTDNAGAAPFTVTLTSSANSQWTSATTVTYTNGTGNLKDINSLELFTVTAHAVVVETTAPAITNVTIPNVAMKIGDPVTATISTLDDDGDVPLLVSGGTIGGFTIGSLVNTSSTSKTVTFTIAEGGTDVAAGSSIPVSMALKDGQNNTSSTYTTAIAQASDAIDANSPKVVSINRQSTTNGWSTTNGTSASSVVFRVTFSENINGSSISSADFSIQVSGSLSGATVNSIIAQTGTSVYDVTVGSYTGLGIMGLNYVDNNDASTIKDLAGNSTITSLANADGDFTGQTFSIVLPEPANHVTGVSATAVNASQAKVTWTNAVTGQLPTHLLILAKKTGVGAYASVADGVLVTAEEDFSNSNGAAIINLTANPTQTSYTFSNMQSTAQYDFIIYSYSLSSINTSDNIDYKIGSNPTATATLSALTINSLNAEGNGVASSTLSANSISQGVFGFSMTSNSSNGTQTVSSITVHTSATSLGKLSNFVLVRSVDNDFSTGGDNTSITGLTFTPSSTQVVITGLTENISSSLKNYFLMADVSSGMNGATTPVQYSITEVDVIVNLGFVATGTVTGVNYSFISSQQSDIVFSSGVASTFAYINFQAASGLTTASPPNVTASAGLATFQIRDGGGAGDGDNLSTVLTGVTLDLGNNYSYLRRVAIFDASTNIAEVDVTSEFVSFTGLSYSVPDGGNRTFTIRATFSASVIDKDNFQVIVSSATASNTGSGFSAFSPANSNVHSVSVVADRFFYAFPPATALVNQSFGLTVRAVDANNNKDEDNTATVTLSKFSGAGIFSSTEGLIKNLIKGSVSWTQLKYSVIEAFTIRASGGGFPNADLPINILAPAGEPATQTSALSFSPIGLNGVTVNFTNGDGSSRILVAKSSSSVDWNPVDGNGYSANTVFGSGAPLGSGNYVVGSGTGPIAVTGLTSDITYFFRAYEFNGTGGTETYNIGTAAGNPASFKTPKIDSSPPVFGTNSTAQSIAPGTALSIISDFIDDESSVTEALVQYRSVNATNTTFIDGTLTKGTGNAWTGSISAAAIGELGVEYKFKITNGASMEATSSLYKVTINHSAGLTLAINTPIGKSQKNYRIIAIPLVLSPNTVAIFGDKLGGFDEEVWRMYRYENGNMNKLSASSTIGPGKGYWFLTSRQPSSNFMATGTSVTASIDQPFEVPLNPGWNQIGNPYNFNISWEDVRDANPSLSGDLSTTARSYNGSVIEIDEIKKFEGAYVSFTGTAQAQLKIPVAKNPAINGGRIRSNEIKNPLHDEHWEVKFNVSNGLQHYALGGVGMHPQANESVDAYDDFNIPRFFDYLEVKHPKEFYDMSYTKDIVATQENYVWNFTTETNQPGEFISLHWDNSYFGNGSEKLWLMDVETGMVWNMRITDQVSVKYSPVHQWKIAFGSESFVQEATLPDNNSLISTYPNPFNNEISFEVAIAKPSPVILEILDVNGKNVITLINQLMDKGRYVTKWAGRNNGQEEIVSGIYIVRFQSGTVVQHGRIIKN